MDMAIFMNLTLLYFHINYSNIQQMNNSLSSKFHILDSPVMQLLQFSSILLLHINDLKV
jgi:hypothetical protein